MSFSYGSFRSTWAVHGHPRLSGCHEGVAIAASDAKSQATYSVCDELGRQTTRHDRSGVSSVATCSGTLRGCSPPAGGGEYRRYIGGVAIATHFAASGIDQPRWLHTDHLGSTVAISNQAGQVETWLGFDAWGQRRQEDWSKTPWL